MTCLSGGRVSPGEAGFLVLDSANGLDLRGLAVGTPVSPVLIVSAVPVTLHNVLPAPVARELVTHKTTRTGRGENHKILFFEMEEYTMVLRYNRTNNPVHFALCSIIIVIVSLSLCLIYTKYNCATLQFLSLQYKLY